jgi:hypothetical protein
MKYCQGTKCHTYDTTDRKRGSKGNKRNQTRSISTYSYGNGSFCTLTCQNDWWAEHGQRAIDHFGRIEQPIVLDEANAWQVQFNPNCWNDNTLPRYHEVNTITKATRPCEQGDI